MTASWMTSVPEPANGRFVLVGENPYERVAVRADHPDATRGEWYVLNGAGSAPVAFEQLTARPSADPLRPAPPAKTVPLYRTAHAIEDLVAGPAVATYQRYRMAAETVGGALAAQYAQAAMAIRAFVNDLAAHCGAPYPQWDGLGAPEPAGAQTQLMPQVREVDATQQIAAIPSVVAVAAAPAAAQESTPRWSWRSLTKAWFGEQQGPGRRQRAWAALDTKTVSGEGGAPPKVGAPG